MPYHPNACESQTKRHRDADEPWHTIGTIPIPSGELVISDAAYFPDIVVHVMPGEYTVQVKIEFNNSTKIVTAMRAYRGPIAPKRGTPIDTLSVDFARVTVGDHDIVTNAGHEITTDALAQPHLDALMQIDLYGWVPWNIVGTVRTPVVVPCHGDGCYQIYEAIENNECVGVEIDFCELVD